MPSAPPPPSEVKVRTMRSDLESMAQSGGGLPKFQSVKMEGLVAVQEKGGEKKNGAVIVLAVIAAAVVLGLLGYFAYRMFFTQSSLTTQNNAVQTPAAVPAQNQSPAVASSTPTTTPTVTASVAAAPFIHASLFKTPADKTLVLTLPTSSAAGGASSAADLQTFNQKISALLAQANKNAAVIEIVVQTADHHGVAVSDLWVQANAAVISPQLLAAHFNPDATFFAYQDKNGFWPAYVLSLKAGENWLFSQSDIANLESSPSISNFFLANAGTPSASGFMDGTVSSTAVRMLSFPNATPPATFLYGWYKNDLIVSASQAGFMAAMNRL